MSTAATLFTDAFESEVLATAEEHPDVSQWSAAGKNKTKRNPAGEDGAWWRANGPRMVQAWMDWRRKVGWTVWETPDAEPGIELGIEIPVPDTGMELWMVIDRVFEDRDGRLVIVDLKTGARSPESDLQLGVYRYGLWRKYGVAADLGCYWMARDGKASDTFGLQRYTPRLMETWFQRFIAAQDSGIFLPHVTFRCRACAMRDYCAAYGGGKSFMDPDTHVDLQVEEVTQ